MFYGRSLIVKALSSQEGLDKPCSMHLTVRKKGIQILAYTCSEHSSEVLFPSMFACCRLNVLPGTLTRSILIGLFSGMHNFWHMIRVNHCPRFHRIHSSRSVTNRVKIIRMQIVPCQCWWILGSTYVLLMVVSRALIADGTVLNPTPTRMVRLYMLINRSVQFWDKMAWTQRD